MLPKPKSGEKCHNFIPNEHLTLPKLGNSEKNKFTEITKRPTCFNRKVKI